LRGRWPQTSAEFHFCAVFPLFFPVGAIVGAILILSAEFGSEGAPWAAIDERLCRVSARFAWPPDFLVGGCDPG